MLTSSGSRSRRSNSSRSGKDMVTGNESERAAEQQCSNAFEDLLTLALAHGSSVNAMTTIRPTEVPASSLAGTISATDITAPRGQATALRRAYWALRVGAAACFV